MLFLNVRTTIQLRRGCAKLCSADLPLLLLLCTIWFVNFLKRMFCLIIYPFPQQGHTHINCADSKYQSSAIQCTCKGNWVSVIWKYVNHNLSVKLKMCEIFIGKSNILSYYKRNVDNRMFLSSLTSLRAEQFSTCVIEIWTVVILFAMKLLFMTASRIERLVTPKLH